MAGKFNNCSNKCLRMNMFCKVDKGCGEGGLSSMRCSMLELPGRSMPFLSMFGSHTASSWSVVSLGDGTAKGRTKSKKEQQPRLKKSTRSYLLYLLTSYVLAERVEYRRYFCKRVIGNLRAGQVVFWILHVPWCHACEFDALTRITFSDLQQLFTSFSALILLNHDE
jgi:hypothetical protein